MGCRLSAISSRETVRADSCEPRAAFLHRVEFDDELFGDRQTNGFAFGDVEHRAAELLGLELEPAGNPAAAGRLHRLPDLVVLAALLANLDDVALADLIGGDVDLLPVHLDVAVAHELAALGAGRGEAERVDDVVEPQLE